MFQGSLFTRNFLIEGVVETEEWQALDDEHVLAIRERMAARFNGLLKIKNPTEPVTEKDLIYPVLSEIGWGDFVFVQPSMSSKGRSDIPDALLFGDEAALDRGKKESENWLRFQHGQCLVEAKRWSRVLDREDKRDRNAVGVPSTQMLRYLRRADDITEGRLRWGILTNGRHWRLYWQGALSVAEDFFEVDLGKVFNLPGSELDLLDKRPDQFETNKDWRDHILRLFLLFFAPAAFVPDTAGKTFHDRAIAEGRFWEERVARDLSGRVFEDVFPRIAQTLAAGDPNHDPSFGDQYLDEVRQSALVLLYRLLFVLYAEDRNLLPDETDPYRRYSLTTMRIEIAEQRARGETPSERIVTYWPRLKAVFKAICEGDDALGIPPYNGGLFDPDAAPILERTEIPDAVITEALFRLSYHDDSNWSRGPKYINYRDLSVQQLGAVYEGILEYGLRLSNDGQIEIAADAEARHRSGSFYTPEDLVSLIIERAVGPLVDDLIATFTDKASNFASDRRAVAARLSELAAFDPATRILSLRVVDPAMGSGHFLVSLVDWLSDRVLAAMAEAEQAVEWGQYVSPLSARVEAIRDTIVSEARNHNWPIVETQLDDRHIVRRMVLKRVVHGVDKNPMAVELAKVTLWLHSFTVGAPLSFLDHHLRCGDSVLGAWVRPTLDWLSERGALFRRGQIARVEQVADTMAAIEATTDNDISEVNASKEAFKTVEDAIRPVAAFFSLLTAERLMRVFDTAPKKAPQRVADLVAANKPDRTIKKAREDNRNFDRAAALQSILEGTFGDPIRIASGEEEIASPDLMEQFALLPDDELGSQSSLFPSVSDHDRRRWIADRIIQETRSLALEHNFLHWEIGFPNVWSNLTSVNPSGGFDAVIGNPPYVRQELLAEIKPALKKAYKCFDGMADLYVYFYEQGIRLLKPGGRMGFVVTNKWLRAGYAEGLRELFADPKKAEIGFIADFGHAKHFFPDADVFPSVLIVRKPGAHAPAIDAEVCVIPRDAVPRKNLAAAVDESTFPLPRDVFTKDGWTLEPAPVMRLLEKINVGAMPLSEFANTKPYRGVTTGCNEAFFIDEETRDRLLKEDPRSNDIIKPFLRGQDIERWGHREGSIWLIFARRGIDIEKYPAVLGHLSKYRDKLAPRPKDWKPVTPGERWTGRKPGNYQWYEIQDAIDYWEEFERPKIIYQAIQYYAAYAYDFDNHFISNKVFLLPTDDLSILAIMNSPLAWWISWRHFVHMKDEALSNDGIKIVNFAVPVIDQNGRAALCEPISRMLALSRIVRAASRSISDWLNHEFGICRPGRALSEPHRLDADSFVRAVRAALNKGIKLSAADIGRLKREHRDTVEPARRAANEILSLERKLSDLVNAAYGLTPEEVKLMWETAPPRMPLDPAQELRRLKSFTV